MLKTQQINFISRISWRDTACEALTGYILNIDSSKIYQGY